MMFSSKAIRDFRGSLGLSRLDFGDELCVGPQTVYRWETGVQQPSRESSKMLYGLAEKENYRLNLQRPEPYLFTRLLEIHYFPKKVEKQQAVEV